MASVSHGHWSSLRCGAPASSFSPRSSSESVKLPVIRRPLAPAIGIGDGHASRSSHFASQDSRCSTSLLAEPLFQSLPQEPPPGACRKPVLISRLALKERPGIPVPEVSEIRRDASRRLRDADGSFEAIASAFSTWNGSLSCRGAVAILNEEQSSKKALAFLQWLKTNDAFTPNVYVYNVLLKVLRREGKWNDALELMQGLEQEGINPDNITYSTIISFAVQYNAIEEAFKWYDRMQEAGCIPDQVVYDTMINAYGKVGLMKEAFEMYANLRRQGFGLDNSTCSTIMKLHAMQGNAGAAMDTFEEMKRENVIPNAVTFNCIIGILLKAGRTQQILKLFDEMQTLGVKPSVVTFSLLVRAYGKARKPDDAFKLFNTMREEGIEIDTLAYNSLLSLCADAGLVEEGERILKELLQSEKYLPDSWTWSTVVNMYAKEGRMNEAKKSLENISHAGLVPDIAAYTSLIRGYSNFKDFKGVGAVFDELVMAGLPCDELLVGTLLQMVLACEEEEDTTTVMNCIKKARPRLWKVIDMLVNECFLCASWTEEFMSFITETPSKSRTVYCNLLMNLCWAKNLGERSHQVMGQAILFGMYTDLQRQNIIEWCLNLRSLSFGAARTALQVWLRSVSNALQLGEKLPPVLVIEAGMYRSRARQTPMNAFIVSQLEEMHAPFKESVCQSGRYAATGETVKTWMQSEGYTLWNTAP